MADQIMGKAVADQAGALVVHVIPITRKGSESMTKATAQKLTARRFRILNFRNIDDGWKAEVARRIVIRRSTTKPNDMPPEILDKVEAVFQEVMRR